MNVRDKFVLVCNAVSFFYSTFSVAARKSETLFGEEILQALPDVLESLQSICRLLFPRWTIAQVTRNTHGGRGNLFSYFD